ncbi:MAG: recombination protein NinB [Burkholderiales bacterium]|nr:recombination protein NinB [Burkholderiales bacterium]
MPDRFTARLWSAQQGHQAVEAAWGYAKPLLLAEHRLVLEVRPENRSLDQNAHFHALCVDIARSGIEWFGKPRKAEEWKVLLVSGHAKATKQEADVVPGLEGELVNLRESTARMSRARASSLIEYTLAFCAEHGVALRDARQWEINPETGEIS